MTDLLYQTDSYLRTFEANVIRADENQHAILLDRTAFYPGGGGQPYDLGSLHWGQQSGFLRRAKNLGGDIWHFLDAEQPLPPPEVTVRGELDWERRYQTMRTHTAMHILCGVIFRDYGAQVTGGDMEPLQGRMDFEFENMTAELVNVIEEAINREVEAAREIRIAILPREEAFKIPDLIRTKINLLPPGIQRIRTIEIVGLDLQADGGTHVHNTREVGKLHISDYKSKGRINKRIYLQLEKNASQPE